MNKQHTRRRRTRCAVVRALAVGGAAAALAAVLSGGQALAAVAPPDERVLARPGRIDNQAAANQADEKATEVPRRWIRPEPPMDTGPRLDPDQQVAPAPAPPASDDAGPGLTAPAILAALILVLAAITTWRVRRHSRPRPRPDATS